MTKRSSRGQNIPKQRRRTPAIRWAGSRKNLGFRGNPLSISANASVSSYPGAAWGSRARYEVSPEFYSITGAYNTYGDFRSDKCHGVDFSTRHNSGVAIMEELGYSPDPLRKVGYPSIFKLGGLCDSEPRLQFKTGQMRGGTWQVYLTGQRRLLPRPEGAIKPHQGLWVFLALTYAPPEMNMLEYFADAELLYFGLIPHRPNDELGLFGLLGQFSSDLRQSERATNQPAMTHEASLEANYMYSVTPWLTVQPDIQGVFQPGGTDLISYTLVLAVQLGIIL